MGEQMKRRIVSVAGFLLLTGLLAACLLSALNRWWTSPCRVEVECRYQNVKLEELVALEKQEKDGMTGLLAVAGWRYGEAKEAIEPESGKTAQAGTVFVGGSMAAAFPSKVLSGSFEQVMRAGDCVVTKTLSYALFGSVDTAGNRLIFAGKTCRIAAVIDREEELVLLPETEGRAERAAFLFADRERTKEKLAALGFEWEHVIKK